LPTVHLSVALPRSAPIDYQQSTISHQLTPPGLPAQAGEAGKFMSKDRVTVPKGERGETSALQDKPPSLTRRPWTAEEDSLLGTKSDHALARKLGRTVKAVKNRRRLKGVFLVKEWRPEDDKILGTRPDRQVALLLGRLIENVAWRRRKLGIPCCYENLRWTPEQLELVGQKPDEEVATLTGHPLFAVKVKRRELGRPKADPILSCWTPEQDRLLGTMPDDEVGRQVGRSKMAVQKRRFRLGIECYRPDGPS